MTHDLKPEPQHQQTLESIKQDMQNYIAFKKQQEYIIKQQQFLNSLPYKDD